MSRDECRHGPVANSVDPEPLLRCLLRLAWVGALVLSSPFGSSAQVPNAATAAEPDLVLPITEETALLEVPTPLPGSGTWSLEHLSDHIRVIGPVSGSWSETQPLRILVSARRSLEAGRAPFARIRFENEQSTKELHVHVDVEPHVQLEVEVNSDEFVAHRTRPAVVVAEIENQGNSTVDVQLETDWSDDFRIRTQNSITIGSRSTKHVPIEIHAHERARAGLHTFRLRVIHPSASARVYLRARIPPIERDGVEQHHVASDLTVLSVTDGGPTLGRLNLHKQINDEIELSAVGRTRSGHLTHPGLSNLLWGPRARLSLHTPDTDTEVGWVDGQSFPSIGRGIAGWGLRSEIRRPGVQLEGTAAYRTEQHGMVGAELTSRFIGESIDGYVSGTARRMADDDNYQRGAVVGLVQSAGMNTFRVEGAAIEQDTFGWHPGSLAPSLMGQFGLRGEVGHLSATGSIRGGGPDGVFNSSNRRITANSSVHLSDGLSLLANAGNRRTLTPRGGRLGNHWETGFQGQVNGASIRTTFRETRLTPLFSTLDRGQPTRDQAVHVNAHVPIGDFRLDYRGVTTIWDSGMDSERHRHRIQLQAPSTGRQSGWISLEMHRRHHLDLRTSVQGQLMLGSFKVRGRVSQPLSSDSRPLSGWLVGELPLPGGLTAYGGLELEGTDPHGRDTRVSVGLGSRVGITPRIPGRGGRPTIHVLDADSGDPVAGVAFEAEGVHYISDLDGVVHLEPSSRYSEIELLTASLPLGYLYDGPRVFGRAPDLVEVTRYGSIQVSAWLDRFGTHRMDPEDPHATDGYIGLYDTTERRISLRPVDDEGRATFERLPAGDYTLRSYNRARDASEGEVYGSVDVHLGPGEMGEADILILGSHRPLRFAPRPDR